MKRIFFTCISIIAVFISTIAQTITIDYQLTTQPVPDNYKPGIFFVPKTTNASNDFLNNGIHYNSIRLISIESAMNRASTPQDVMAELESLKSNILLVNSRCDKVILPILKMPSWLSSSSDTTFLGGGFRVYNAMPPSDYVIWNLLMDSIVHKINVQWGLDPYYEIWNEPNVSYYWQGTEQEYFELFRNTFFAIKNTHPSAKVGGPVVSGFTAKFNQASFPGGYLSASQLDSTIIGMVIDSVVCWNASLDFISWHNFGNNLHMNDMIFNYLDRNLTNSGHGIVPYVVSEWNHSSSLRESAEHAAYMINYNQALEEHGVSAHQVAAWQDFDSTSTEFYQGYGLLSWGALEKPAWKALRLLNSLRGELLSVDSSDYRRLNVVSTYENDTLKVLISNYSLQGLQEAVLSLYYDYEFSETDLQTNGYDPYKLDSIMQGLIILTGTDSLTQAINSVIPVYQEADAHYLNGRNINLVFPGLTGIHTGIQTIIDSTHNNVIYKYDSLINDGYSHTDAVQMLYPNNSFESENISITDSVYSFHLQANGIILIELYIPEFTVSIPKIIQNDNLVIYPNPASGLVRINFNEQDVKNIFVYDIRGQLVNTYSTTSFSIENYIDGIYIVIINAKNEVWTRKLIKE